MPKSFFLPSKLLIEATTTRDSSSKKLWFNPYLPGSKRSECFPEVDGQEHQERQDLYHSLTIYYIILYTHDTHLTHWQDSLHSYISLTIPLSSMIYCTYYIHIYTYYIYRIPIIYTYCIPMMFGFPIWATPCRPCWSRSASGSTTIPCWPPSSACRLTPLGHVRSNREALG